MKIINYVSFILLVVQIMAGPYCSEDKNDCTKLYNFVNENKKIYGVKDCCSEPNIHCNDGFITSIDKSTSRSLNKPNIFNHNLDYKSFPCFSRLRTLILDNLFVEEIPSGILNSESLIELSLSHGRITTISDKLFQLPNLENLILSYNKIGSIPSSVNNATKLNQLHLINNNIKELPAGLFELPNLKKIDLSVNEISAFPSISYNETKLNEININNNKIVNLPDQLFKMPKLETLYLNGNRIKEIPGSISNAIALKKLHINNNYINELPIQFYNLSNLEILDLSANELTKISPSVSGLKNLTEIFLNDNKLNGSELPGELFKLPNLEIIHLRNRPTPTPTVKPNPVPAPDPVPVIDTGTIIICIILICTAILMNFMFIKGKSSKNSEFDRQEDSFQNFIEDGILNMNQFSQNLRDPNNTEIENYNSISQIDGYTNNDSSDRNEENRSPQSKVDIYTINPSNQGFGSSDNNSVVNIQSDIYNPNNIPAHNLNESRTLNEIRTLNESRNFIQSRTFNSNLGCVLPPASQVTSGVETAVNTTENGGRSSDHPEKTYDNMSTNNNEQN